MKHPSETSILDFTYALPPEKIAGYPVDKRDESKLLVFKNKKISEGLFKAIPDLLKPETLLVFNNARVIPARLLFLNSNGKAIELFCLEPEAEYQDLSLALATKGKVRWHCLVGNLKHWREEMLRLNKGAILLDAKSVARNTSYVTVEFTWKPEELSFAEVLQAVGQMPIPPYLKRASEAVDELRYQTVYAQQEGSVAAPTAGLHFTKEILEELGKRSIHSTSVVLHVGAGTFKPVKSETMHGHDMHTEWMEVERNTLLRLLEQDKNDIIAVGTTSLRTLETLYWMGVKALLNPSIHLEELEIKQWDAYEQKGELPDTRNSLLALLRWLDEYHLTKLICKTQILIAPPYQLKVATGLITNFHQPQSSLLLLIGAIVGDDWKKIYAYALANNFRFLSYGDSSLLLK